MTQAERHQLAHEAQILSYYQDMPPEQLHAAWAQIQPGTEKRAIKHLLGEPERIEYNREASAWYYSNAGRIAFNWEGRAVDVQRPAEFEKTTRHETPVPR